MGLGLGQGVGHQMSKILVTGMNGYISSVLVPKLVKAGHIVIPFLGLVEAQKNWSEAPVGYDVVIHLAAYNDLRVAPYTLSVSVGSSPYDPTAPTPVEALLVEADANMYAEKRGKIR